MKKIIIVLTVMFASINSYSSPFLHPDGARVECRSAWDLDESGFRLGVGSYSNSNTDFHIVIFMRRYVCEESSGEIQWVSRHLPEGHRLLSHVPLGIIKERDVWPELELEDETLYKYLYSFKLDRSFFKKREMKRLNKGKNVRKEILFSYARPFDLENVGSSDPDDYALSGGFYWLVIEFQKTNNQVQILSVSR